MAIEPNWSGKRLLPTGQLSILEAAIRQTEHIIIPRILAVDEVGVQWLLNHSDFPFDMHPHKLPETFRARYKVELMLDKYTTYRFFADADNMADAIEKVKACSHFYVPDRGEWSMNMDDPACVQPATGSKPNTDKD